MKTILLLAALALCAAPSRCAEPRALAETPAASSDAGAGDPRDFPRPAGLTRTSYSDSRGAKRDQEVAQYRSDESLDGVWAAYRRELAAAGWKEHPASDSGTGLRRVVFSDWDNGSREAELRLYPSRKGGTDVWARVDTYHAAAPAGTAAAAEAPPSRNSPVVLVPSVIGKAPKDAEWSLRGSGFSVAWAQPRIVPAGPGVAADRVEAQDPAAGQRTARGSTVTLTATQYMARVPVLIGLSHTIAEQRLRAAHLRLEDGPPQAATDPAKAGTVASAQPAAGALARPDSAVFVSCWRAAGPVPDVVGRSLSAAQTLLAGPPGGPRFASEQAPPQAVTGPGQQPGTVAAQDPAAGTVAVTGSPVRLSLWQSPVRVPDLVGKRDSGAQLAHPAPGVNFVIRHGPPKATTDASKAGTIAEQSPAAGQPAMNGSTIVVSLWTMTGVVPNVVGKTYADAEQTLRSGRGGTARFVAQAGPGVPTRDRAQDGRIAQQSPAAEATALDGETVVLSRWALLQPVPSLVGAGVDGARRQLEHLGFIATIGPARPAVDPALDGRVAAQSPPAGAVLASGEPVTLTVYRTQPPD